MTTKDVYKTLGTPINLQNHMLVVAGLVKQLQAGWNGPKLNWIVIIKAALLHDIGNVIKFDLDNYPQLLGGEQLRIDFWKAEQARLVSRYGNDDHKATEMMLGELQVEDAVISIIQQKSFGNAIKTEAAEDWPSKLLFYCDLRVLPSGVGSLNDRLDDVRARLVKYSERDDFEELVAACYQIESHIQDHLTEKLSKLIDQKKADSYREELLNFQIS